MSADAEENGSILDGLKYNLDSLKFIFRPSNYKKNIYRVMELKKKDLEKVLPYHNIFYHILIFKWFGKSQNDMEKYKMIW